MTPVLSTASTESLTATIPVAVHALAIGGRSLPEFVWFVVGLLLITAAAAIIQHRHGMRLGRQMFTGVARASIQLTIVAVLLRGILSVPWTVVFFIALMLTTASLTSIGRLKGMPHAKQAVLLGVIAGGLAGIAAVFGLRLVDWNTQNLIALSGILIGNAMTAATLAGRAFREAAVTQSSQVEAWFSLGASAKVAYRDIAQRAARSATIPNVDQTRATGLVTLPGAFVGALFGGASPAEAAMFQLVVLVGILLVQAVCTTTVTTVLSRNHQLLTDPD